jgi:hypothetical protein
MRAIQDLIAEASVNNFLHVLMYLGLLVVMAFLMRRGDPRG